MQSNGRNKLRRMELGYESKTYKFTINPEDYTVSEPNRANATQTLGGAWIDVFGAGIRELSIKGTTGLTAGTTNPNTGIEKFKELRELIREVYHEENNLRTTKQVTPMKFYNFTDEDYYWVVPTSFDLTRNKTNPLLFRYDIKFIIIGDLGDNLSGNSLLSSLGINSGIIGGFDIIPGVSIVAPNITSDLVNGVSGVLETVVRPSFSSVLSGILGSSAININSNGVSFGTNLNIAGINLPISFGTDGSLSVDALFNDTGTILDGLSLGVGSGCDGKLSPVSFNYAISSLSILSSGLINGLPDKTKNLRAYLEDSTSFIPSVNLRAVKIKEEFDAGDFRSIDIQSYAPTTSNPAEDFSKIVSSYGEKVDNSLMDAMYFNIKEIDAVDVARVKLIMLDAMTVPSSLIAYLNGGRLDTSITDLTRLISNIQVTLNDLQDYTILPKELIRELRNLDIKIRSLLKLGYWGDNV